MSDLDDLLNSLEQPQAAPLSHGSSKYGQHGRSTQVPRSEIDALLGEIDDLPAPAKAKPAPNRASVKPGGDNFDLDSMMAELDGSMASPTPAAKPAPPRQKSVAIKPISGDTNDLDDVLSELGAITGPRQSVMKPKPKQSVTSEVRKERGKTMAQLDDILSSLPGEEPGLDPNANFAPSVAPIQYHAGAPRRAEPVYTASSALPAGGVQPAARAAATPGDAPVIRDDIGAEIVSEINFLRTKPKQYADMLRKDRMPYFRPGNKLALPGWKKIVPTQEGTKAVQEAIDVLSAYDAMQPLEEWPGMSAAAHEAVADSGAKGVMKKYDSLERLQNHDVDPDGNRFLELLGFGEATARELVCRLVVGDGDAERYDRTALTDPAMRFVGVAYGDHRSQYKKMLCINIAEGFKGAPEPDVKKDPIFFDPRPEQPLGVAGVEGTGKGNPPGHAADMSPAMRDAIERLAEGVRDRAAREVADAAKGLAAEINSLPDPDDPNARKALEDAAERLRKLLKGLLGAAKAAMQNPEDPRNQQIFDKLLDEFKKAAKDATAISRGDLSSLDQISTMLLQSGMIDAAAAAAKELQSAFNM